MPPILPGYILAKHGQPRDSGIISETLLEQLMQLISVNIGEVQPIRYSKDETDTTGIWKSPVNKPVDITRLDVTGDHVLDMKAHAGPDQAVYVYGGADYTWWSQQLGSELAPGTFGDNLTISDLERAPLN